MEIYKSYINPYVFCAGSLQIYILNVPTKKKWYFCNNVRVFKKDNWLPSLKT